MIGITGRRSTIAQEFMKLTGCDPRYGSTGDLPLDLPEYLLCAGVLVGKQSHNIKDDEAWQTMAVNYIDVARFCNRVFRRNPNAKICVIGSESGYNGSYDEVYAGSKAALGLYVKTKKLQYPGQHLVCVSPTIIEDSGMTKRRVDHEQAMKRGKDRRLGRWLNSKEVARVAAFALREPSMCNTVVHLTGGNW